MDERAVKRVSKFGWTGTEQARGLRDGHQAWPENALFTWSNGPQII